MSVVLKAEDITKKYGKYQGLNNLLNYLFLV